MRVSRRMALLSCIVYLNVWFPMVTLLWEVLGVVALAKEVCHWGVGFEEALFLPPACKFGSNLSATAPTPCLPDALLATMMVTDVASEPVSQPPVKCFVL